MKIKKLSELTKKELWMRMLALYSMPFKYFKDDDSGRKTQFVHRQWIKMSMELRGRK